MKTGDLIYYNEMKTLVDYYVNSPSYRSERLIPIDAYKSGEVHSEIPVILGRNGYYHHYDFEHLEILRRDGVIPLAEDTTLVLYDWHDDLSHDPVAGTDLCNGTWAYLGLTERLYHNLYVIGINPSGYNELNMFLYDEERLVPTPEETMKLLDRVCLYPMAPSYLCLKLFEECVPFLASNPSVEKSFLVEEGGFAAIKFKGASEVTYQERRPSVVISIDLDVLRKSEVVAECGQGAMTVDTLLAELTKVSKTGKISAIMICGLTESPDRLNTKSLESVSRILSHCSSLMDMT